MEEALQQRFETEMGLHRALERAELRVVYQPILQLATRTLVGFEALVRWEHPERGLISPAEFIPIAEQAGLIVPLGEYVLAEACRQLMHWMAEYAPGPLTMAVNLSGRQFRSPQLVEQVRAVMASTGIGPKQLALEITESVLMETDDADLTLQTVHQLRAMGVYVDIDDFGTGYSSLSSLKRLPVTSIKIDRSFVRTLGIDPKDNAIVSAIIGLAHALGLRVVAEGIETEAQAAELVRLDCDFAQGFLFARPRPAQECVPYLVARRALLQSISAASELGDDAAHDFADRTDHRRRARGFVA
jgi:EAL domain-containing protein (putative c-di-GMP-specific phosphodiesterase class I)